MQRLGDFLSSKRRLVLLLAPALIGACFLLLCQPLLQFSMQKVEIKNYNMSQDAPLVGLQEDDQGSNAKKPAEEVEKTSAELTPIYYTTLNYWSKLFGTHDFDLRFLSYLAITLSILAIFIFTNREFGLTAACYTSILLASSPILLHFGALTSPIALLVFIFSSSQLALSFALESRRVIWSILYIIQLGIGLLYSPCYALIFAIQIPYIIFKRKNAIFHPKNIGIFFTLWIFILVGHKIIETIFDKQILLTNDTNLIRFTACLLGIILALILGYILANLTHRLILGEGSLEIKRYSRLLPITIIFCIVLNSCGYIRIMDSQNRDAFSGRAAFEKRLLIEANELREQTEMLYVADGLYEAIHFYAPDDEAIHPKSKLDEKNTIDKTAEADESRNIRYWQLLRSATPPDSNSKCAIETIYKSNIDDGSHEDYYIFSCLRQ